MTVVWVDELTGTVLDLRQADGLVKALREVGHVEQFEHDALPVNANETVTQLGDCGTAVEPTVGEETAKIHTNIVLFLVAFNDL